VPKISGNAFQQGTQAAMREQRSREAAQAMQEYEADKFAILAKSERLRALRLANEAINAPSKPTRRRVKQDR
jgi:hypothetical protein